MSNRILVSDNTPTYLSYLLRLWREEHGGQYIWRASLEVPGEDKRRAFADLAALAEFLAAQTAPAGPDGAVDTVDSGNDG